MFDIWRKIDEEGTVAVPTCPASLPALGWVEVGEKYPELIPEEYRRYDVYSDQLDSDVFTPGGMNTSRISPAA